MDKTRKVVLFDTNSYRDFVKDKTKEESLEAIQELIKLENSKNIEACGISVVAMEMMGHLSNNTEPGYDECLNGVLAMVAHCFDETIGAPRFTPQPYLQIAKAFFNVIPPEMESKVKNLVGVAQDLHSDLEKALEHHVAKGTFNQVRTYIENEEQGFCNNLIALVDGIEQEVKNQSDPTVNLSKGVLKTKKLELIASPEFEETMSYAFILTTAASINSNLPFAELISRAKSLVENFPLAVGFYKWICREMIVRKIDMHSKTSKKKRWNWNWDYQVSFLMSGTTLEGREVILVTADGDMTEILRENGFQNRVMTLSEYIHYLKE